MVKEKTSRDWYFTAKHWRYSAVLSEANRIDSTRRNCIGHKRQHYGTQTPIWESYCYCNTTCATAVNTDQVQDEQPPSCQATNGGPYALLVARTGMFQQRALKQSLEWLLSRAGSDFSSEAQGSQQTATHVHEEEDFSLQPLQQQVQLYNNV